MLDEFGDGLAAGDGVEFVHGSSGVGLDGVGAQARQLGHLPCGQTPGIPAQDLGLPGGQVHTPVVSVFCSIGTLVERTTRFTILLHLPDGHDAEHVQQAIIDKMQHLPKLLRNSLTWDQGAELALHKRIGASLDMAVYFCDPHSPWQRGTNENTNGLLRQYFPKGTDLSVYPEDYLDAVAEELNDRPRKTLGFMKPSEKIIELLDAA